MFNKRSLQKGLTYVTTVTTIVWSMGGALLAPLAAHATVLEAVAASNGPVAVVKANSSVIVAKFRLTTDASDNLTALKATIVDVGSSGTIASDFSGMTVWRDHNGSNASAASDDTLVTTQGAANQDTLMGGVGGQLGGSVTVGSLMTLALGIHNGIPGTGATGRGTVEYFVLLGTASGAVSNHTFRVTLEAGNNTYILNGGGGGTVSATALTGQTITIDTTAPTATGAGGPNDAQDFTPLEAGVDRTFSEALLTTSATETNITLKKCNGTTQTTADTACGAQGAVSPTVDSTNLCAVANAGSIALSVSDTKVTCTHANLTTNSWYEFRFTTAVTDAVGNALAATQDYRFKTSSTNSSSNTTPPRVMSTIPTSGTPLASGANLTVAFPTGTEGNMNFNTGSGSTAQAGDLNFCQSSTCAVSIKKIDSTTHLGTTEVCTNSSTCAFTWNSTSRELTVNPASNLDVASGSATPVEYDLCVRGGSNTLGVKNSSSRSMSSDYCLRFTTTVADTTAPTLSTTGATNPPNASTNVSPFSTNLSVKFGEKMDSGTLSLTTVRLCADSTAGTAGCEVGDTRLTNTANIAFRYDSVDSSVHLGSLANASLASSTKYCFEIVAGVSGVKDISGNQFAATSSANCFTTGSATDPVSGGPQLRSVDADDFKLVAKFNEAMQYADLISGGNVNTANVALECPTGQVISLASKAASYRAEFNELEIQGLGLPKEQTCKLTVTNAKDLAGNAMDTTDPDTSGPLPANNVNNFKVLDSATTGGFLGSGAVAGTGFFEGNGGATAGGFWERPQRVEPTNKSTNKATSVTAEFPAPGAMPVGSTIELTFPSGFTLSTGDGNARLVPAAQSFNNADLNGPGESGTVTATATTSTGERTITLTTAAAAIVANQMLRFDIDRVTTPTSSADNLRITIVVKDNTGLKIGQTLNPAPFSIQQGGSLAISGKVCKGTTSGGSCGGGDTGIANVKVFCSQQGGFQVGGTSAAYMGNQETITAGDGTWSIAGLTAGGYSCNIPPDPTRLADLGGSPPFQPITLSTVSKTGVDTKYKDLSAAGGATDVKTLTISISGGPASKSVDVFCSAGATSFEFSAPSQKEVALDGSGAATATLRLNQNNTYQCGMGPHIAFEQFGTGRPAPAPEFTFMPPRSQQVTMTANKTITFALQSTNRTIAGSVKDASNAGISNVYVHAVPVGCFDATSGAVKDCFGGFAQTKSDGTFTLNVADGTYEVGADGPGLPQSTREIANVNGANVTGMTLKMVKSSTTISGAVQDESGNGIQYAHVSAERRTITTGSDACDFANSRPSGGFADSSTDSSGNFTLYTSNGTWCIRAGAPSYGEVGTKTVTVADSSLTGQNIAATAANFGTVSGTVTKASTNVSGASINCFGSNGGNNAQSGAAGTYSLKVKLASSGTTTVTCDGYAPGIGQLTRATVTFTQGVTTATQNFTLAGNPGTITVTATGLTEGFCDARNSNGVGSGAPIQNGTASIFAQAGTYTVRCGTRQTGPLTLSASSVVLTAGGTSALTATVPTLRTVTGRVTDGTSNLGGATMTLSNDSGASIPIVTGSQTGSTSNLSGSNIPEGTYNVRVTKKGYEPATTTATVSGGNLTLSSAIAMTPTTGASGETVTFPVQADSAAYTGSAKVICTKDGKTVAVEIDSTTGNGSADLSNGSWSCKASGDNGKESAASTVTVANGVLSGSAPTLSLATAITGYTAKSDSGTFPLSSGGTVSFPGLAVGSATPSISIPTGAFSTTDSSTAKMEMKTDATVAGIDPGTDANVVGSFGYEITPKDANNNKATNTDAVTVTIPYTDADVATAGVTESKLTVASFNTSSQAWETVPTTVDTVNNLLIASVSHFSSFGVIGTVAASSSSGNHDTTPPAEVTAVSGSSADGKITIKWTDPSDADLNNIAIFRNFNPSGVAVNGAAPYATVLKGLQTYTDTGPFPSGNGPYLYQLVASDNASNTSVGTTTVSVTLVVAATTGGSTGGGGGGSSGGSTGGGTGATTVTTPPATTPTPIVPTAPLTIVIPPPAEPKATNYGKKVKTPPSDSAKKSKLSMLEAALGKKDGKKMVSALSDNQKDVYAHAMMYGLYPASIIADAIKTGAKLVSPSIPYTTFQRTPEYKKEYAKAHPPKPSKKTSTKKK